MDEIMDTAGTGLRGVHFLSLFLFLCTDELIVAEQSIWGISLTRFAFDSTCLICQKAADQAWRGPTNANSVGHTTTTRATDAHQADTGHWQTFGIARQGP